MASVKYTPSEIEPKWQAYWAEKKTFKTGNPGDAGFDTSKPKYYVLDMFPYPSGAGLHVGHPEGYTATDILARYKRMNGHNVLHPMGWDAFGLPAEQYAMQTGTHPAVTTQKNIDNFRSTLQRLGFSYDWDREVDTTDPNYFKWTQWIFLKIFNSIFDPRINGARDVAEIIAELKANLIGLKDEKTLMFFMTGEQCQEAGLGKQWNELTPDAQWTLLSNYRLAYVDEAPVWWCDGLGTVLANEEVIDGRSERGDYPCVKKPLRQWKMRITAYAERLIDDLDAVDWPESIKLQQRNWIGRSEGAEVDFELASNPGTKLRVFTTRPDTLYGATYMVVSPEHPLVKELTSPEQQAAVEKYVVEASGKSDLDRGTAKEKTGVFSGSYAFNPVYEDHNDPRAKIPIWIADYVLMGYGTGAIMAVPAHDERDAEFAVKFGLPIVSVVMPPEKWLADNSKTPSKDVEVNRKQFAADPTSFKTFFVEDGIAFNSPAIDGLHTPDAKKKIIEWLEAKKIGVKKVTYRLRDWLFSRQRYWGEPFPICWDEQGNARPLTEDSLPLTPPEMIDFKPSGTSEPPLSKATEWVNGRAEILSDGSVRMLPLNFTTGIPVRRETNTMPQWAGSCWYYLRYMDNKNSHGIFGKPVEDYWMNVDLYVGGAEHAVLHLLYSRFWHKVLFDRGIVKDKEPFKKLFNQGLITAFSYLDETGRKIPSDEVEEKSDGVWVLKATGAPLKQITAKMSKTLKNVVNPNDVIDEFGSDTLRLYEMFMGPLDGSKPWSPRDVPGMYRFLRDCWRLIIEDDEREPKAGNLRMNLLPSASELIGAGAPGDELERDLHKTIKGVTQDIERMAFNTAISKLMVFKNRASEDVTQLTRAQAKRFLLLLSPFAPHIAEELWSRMRHGQSISLEVWPKFDDALTKDATKELAIQVNGKIKGRVIVDADATDDVVKAQATEAVKADLAGKTVVKMVVVPGRLVNIVVK
ncbi:MAG: leucine--tRNA ligase [Planctomycetota bacterium]